MPEPTKTRRRKLTEAVAFAAQRSATDAVMMHQAIADRIGLAVTDLRCLNILRRTGPTTPGELSSATGLTTGAITRMIDRLLAAGFVGRAHDERDRRRVIITAVPERMAELAPYYEPISTEFDRLTADYTDGQLELILGLLNRLHEASLRVTTGLRTGDIDGATHHAAGRRDKAR